MERLSILGEDRATDEMVEAPSDDPINHRMVETVPLGEEAAAMEADLGEVRRGPRQEMAMVIHPMGVAEIHSSTAYLMVLPRMETMLMDLAEFNQSRYQHDQIIRN